MGCPLGSEAGPANRLCSVRFRGIPFVFRLFAPHDGPQRGSCGRESSGSLLSHFYGPGRCGEPEVPVGIASSRILRRWAGSVEVRYRGSLWRRPGNEVTGVAATRRSSALFPCNPLSRKTGRSYFCAGVTFGDRTLRRSLRMSSSERAPALRFAQK